MQACFFEGMVHGLQNIFIIATAFIIAIAAALLAAPSARAQGAGEPTGVWLTQAGDARVKVSKCGGGICGVIVGLKDPIDPATGKPQVDDKNPNPALKKRPMIGLPLFSGMQPSRRPTNGRARSTTPMTAAPMRAASRWRARIRCGSKAASARSAAARPGRGWDGERRPLRQASWAERSVPTTLESTMLANGGHAALCPPYELRTNHAAIAFSAVAAEA